MLIVGSAQKVVGRHAEVIGEKHQNFKRRGIPFFEPTYNQAVVKAERRADAISRNAVLFAKLFESFGKGRTRKGSKKSFSFVSPNKYRRETPK